MITGIFTLLGVLVGFYLAKYLEVNKTIQEKTENIKQKIQKNPPKVIKTDEVALEKEEQGKEKEKEKITLKDIFKK